MCLYLWILSRILHMKRIPLKHVVLEDIQLADKKETKGIYILPRGLRDCAYCP